jgi:hypothetical protein
MYMYVAVGLDQGQTGGKPCWRGQGREVFSTRIERNKKNNSTMMKMISQQVLDALLSPVAAQRQQAEAFLTTLSASDRSLSLLQAVGSNDLPPHLQHMAAVLLRRDILKSNDAPLLQSMIASLLQSYHRPAVGDCIAEVCAVLSFLGVSIPLEQQPMGLAWLSLLTKIADRAPKAFLEMSIDVSNLVGYALQQPGGPNVALELVVRAAEAAQGDNNLGLLSSSLLQLLPHANDQDLLLHAAEHVPSLFRQPALLEQTVQACSSSADLQGIHVVAMLVRDNEIRRMISPKLRAAMLQTSLATCLSVMKTDEDDDFLFAQELLECLVAVYSDHALPILLPMIEAQLSQQDGIAAALGALASCMQAAPMSFQPHVPTAVQAALSYSNSDGHVQYQSLVLLGVAMEGSATCEASVLLPVLSHAAQSPSTKIASLACKVLTSFCAQNNQVAPFLEHVLTVLSPLICSESREPAMQAVAALAQATGGAFLPFYGHVMPGLLQLNDPGAIEAAAMIGQAVGKERFATDAHAIMQHVTQRLSSTDEDGIDQLLSACARVR